ncbi:MAG TPA: hypothetical protein VFQ85_16100 [Mycobacteriales bacterium]|nr:hypothetical protein [Mycobacteriales bacterium]
MAEDRYRPSRATAEGQMIEFGEHLSHPGNPARARRMLVFIVVFAVVVLGVIALLNA